LVDGAIDFFQRINIIHLKETTIAMKNNILTFKRISLFILAGWFLLFGSQPQYETVEIEGFQPCYGDIFIVNE